MVSVGNDGFNWSATANVFFGVYLNFSMQLLNPSIADGHAYGFQLRCLSE
ncbi:hypothetical protein [uncultured Rikenella sp.]|nr:hypothetical protein [uncultured Rikenella sp.]